MAGPRASGESQLEQLADEQAALRRVATLVAQGAAAEALFTVVAEQVAEVLRVPIVSIVRYEPEGTATERASVSPQGAIFRIGTRWSLEGTNVVALVRDSTRPARIDDYAGLAGEIAERCKRVGIRSTVGIPIVVAGRLWGAMIVSSLEPDTLPQETETRLTDFTELVATAIANSESSEQAARLAREQAALRRVATLVARGAAQAEVFGAIAEEIGQSLGTEEIRMVRYEDERSAIVVASSGKSEDLFPIGIRLPLGGEDAISRVLETGQPARIDEYATASGAVAEPVRSIGIRGVVATPVVVEGRLWGAMVTGTFGDEPMPPTTETRLGQFTELMAAAIANAESHARAERLTDEQAALRRVATLVAEGALPSAVLDAVAGEMEALLDADQVALNRFEPGEEILVLAHRGLDVARTPVGSRVSTEGESVTATVRRTGRPARMEGYAQAGGALAELARATGLRSSVSVPIVVEGRLWGLITASWKGEQAPSPETEDRMVRFAELLDTAIANADSRDQLTASRARLVTEADEARRRVVRDLHDGGQQRLVHTIVTLKLAQRALRENDGDVEALIGEALARAEESNRELRELAHGLLPGALTRGGLRAGIDAVVDRLDLPVEAKLPAERFSAEIEASAYFIVAEALTNVVKHSRARRTEVRVYAEDEMLHVEVRDDGIGGADPRGHGLVGMADRVTALSGRLEIESPAGGGTLVAATLPLSAG